MDRRTILRWSAAFAVGGIAGCTGGDGSGGDSPTASPAPDSPTASPTPNPTGTPTETPTRTTADPEPTQTPSPTDSPTPSPTPEPTESVAQVVEVAPDGSFTFAPDDFTVATGETVRWVWRAGGHNVKVESTPSGSDWSGTPGSSSDTFGEGHTYSHTFDVAGKYEYYCAPHRGLGMTGKFTVE